MKKWMWLLLLAALLAFTACSIPGNVYISFDWPVSSTLNNWGGSDPNVDTPVVLDELAPGFDYLTLPGTYSFWYTIDSISIPAFYYTLTEHKGSGSPGEDAYFMLFLTTAGPTFYRLQSLTAPSTGGGAANPAPTARSVVQSGSTFDKTGYEFKQLGEYSQTQGAYTLTVRTGVWEPKK
jgi:hypothetical protein